MTGPRTHAGATPRTGRTPASRTRCRAVIPAQHHAISACHTKATGGKGVLTHRMSQHRSSSRPGTQPPPNPPRVRPGPCQSVDAPASSMVDTGEGRRRLAGRTRRGPGWRGGDSPHTGPLLESVKPGRVYFISGCQYSALISTARSAGAQAEMVTPRPGPVTGPAPLPGLLSGSRLWGDAPFFVPWLR